MHLYQRFHLSLLNLNDLVLQEVKDKQCAKMVQKFHKQVRALLLAAKQNPLIGTPGPLPGEKPEVDESKPPPEETAMDVTEHVTTTAEEFMNATARSDRASEVL